ncbi:MAG: hypothetical protein ACKVVT_09785 [Dehalococcoidia bacterium]
MKAVVEIDADVVERLGFSGREADPGVHQAVNALLRETLAAPRQGATPELPLWPLGLKLDIECVWEAIDATDRGGNR